MNNILDRKGEGLKPQTTFMSNNESENENVFFSRNIQKRNKPSNITKTGKTFLVQFARPNSAIWCNNIL